ncbi:TetR family transcriptional regulator [Streptomyces sp. BK022]|uniref:TetR/AcrR family transcriptional regulator n=1 Tax=Streptomyces sp. BK022 TaxID=2512123 RepID=UPI001F5E9884|nr:TetR family transcriptional regulator [Streptomyces sp. BK022]
MPLTEDGIYDVALRLIEADGVEALTMRKLATALNANPMSLYHHVPNKEAVLQGAAARVGSRFSMRDPEDLPWQDRLRHMLIALRELALEHPKLMTYCLGRAEYIQPGDSFWLDLTEVLAAAGLPAEEIPRVAATLCATLTGLMISELTGVVQQWATLPVTPDGGAHPAPTRLELDAMARFALEGAVAAVDNHPARVRERD